MSDIKYSCGMCGTPCDENGNDLPIPENYNPDNYPHDWCNDCATQEQWAHSRMRITREMALDAGDPNLEGEYF